MTSITIDSKVGDEFAGKLRTVTLERVNLFSGGYPKGPNWPAKNIHTDLDCARQCGLNTRAASGAMFEGYLADLMTDIFGEDWLRHGKMSLAFIQVVDKDDALIPKAIVHAKTVKDSKVEYTMEIWCENQHGSKVAVGTAIAIV
jgi:acyl dehydratase